MIIYRDEKYGFFELFNEKNGTLVRGDVNGEDPKMRSFPELLDIGIMGHCDHSNICTRVGIDCYQNGIVRKDPHMSVEDFEFIARQACGKTFQIALGGAGDPNKHPYFGEILQIARHYHIVPNLTTSGVNITNPEIALIKQYCGAVAISWYSRLRGNHETNTMTANAINNLINCGCTTNIHFVISTDTIDEAIRRLEYDMFPLGINAVIFILYKPVGQGKQSKVIKPHDKRIEILIQKAGSKHPYRIGFDTCFTSAILRYNTHFSTASIDSCEASTFSMYIDSQMNCYPCSFGIWKEELAESLHGKTIREIWDGTVFSAFREKQKLSCTNCNKHSLCRGGCKLDLNIDLCEISSRTFEAVS